MYDGLKILLADTEWSYAKGYFFPQKKEQYIRADQIEFEQWCPCASYKWHHETSVYSVKVLDDKKRFKKDFRDDYIIAKRLHDLIEEADIVVAHNGDSFDWKHANGLFLKHGLGPVPERKSLDTLKICRKHFRFSGNDLDSLSRRFGGRGKADKPDWKELTDGLPAAILKAAKYCDHDVLELERVFVEIRPFIRKFPHIGALGEITECRACRSKRLRNKGADYDGFRQYKRITCLDCGHHMKAKL